ncbi:hypothetical protein MTR67_022320 [Solanum verrucosum]|uniref:Uncharacterized protein n=1 Tax=Solanum verrucosum TaxID=315347 RepID=A0AAF0QXM6_SOLVR|nr:hypothetical protein MTR67_022320 [Solanum verrucosum]
MWFSSGPRSVK